MYSILLIKTVQHICICMKCDWMGRRVFVLKRTIVDCYYRLWFECVRVWERNSKNNKTDYVWGKSFMVYHGITLLYDFHFNDATIDNLVVLHVLMLLHESWMFFFATWTTFIHDFYWLRNQKHSKLVDCIKFDSFQTKEMKILLPRLLIATITSLLNAIYSGAINDWLGAPKCCK